VGTLIDGPAGDPGPISCTNVSGDFSGFAFGNMDNDAVGIDSWGIGSQSGTITPPGSCPSVGLAGFNQFSSGVPTQFYNDALRRLR
jgi:hypothetical protein